MFYSDIFANQTIVYLLLSVINNDYDNVLRYIITGNSNNKLCHVVAYQNIHIASIAASICTCVKVESCIAVLNVNANQTLHGGKKPVQQSTSQLITTTEIVNTAANHSSRKQT